MTSFFANGNGNGSHPDEMGKLRPIEVIAFARANAGIKRPVLVWCVLLMNISGRWENWISPAEIDLLRVQWTGAATMAAGVFFFRYCSAVRNSSADLVVLGRWSEKEVCENVRVRPYARVYIIGTRRVLANDS